MESSIYQASKSARVIIGPEGATNFSIVKSANGGAVLIDADIRRIEEVEEALKPLFSSVVEEIRRSGFVDQLYKK
jgi:hypothetical protein